VDYLKLLVKLQDDSQLKIAPKLTQKHFYLSSYDKMRVSFAVHFFSKDVSAALKFLIEIKKLDASAATTAWFIETVQHWFALMFSHSSVMAISKFSAETYQIEMQFLHQYV